MKEELFLKIKRDSKDYFNYRISSIFLTGEFDQDFGYYNKNELLKALDYFKHSKEQIRITKIKFDDRVFDNLEDAIKFFETE